MSKAISKKPTSATGTDKESVEKIKTKSSPLANDAVIVKDLKELYSTRLLPVEKKYLFSKFHGPEILESEMSAKPAVLLLGQYSTGKTTFIRNLIGMDYPEIHIGPEPTTDRFIAVVHGDDLKTIKGNALTAVSDLPFSGLSSFGTGFLNKFSAAVVPAPLLKQLSIIDTPGVLSGEKQRNSRGYDFAKVCRWFAERSDLILLMFDPSKLDISDEFRAVIDELQPHEDKVHCVLNKADNLDTEALMRVYGALLWSMGKVFRGAEVVRVYVGSFKDTPLIKEDHAKLFEKDRDVLLNKLQELPKACGIRKVNEMVKRIRLAAVNVCVLGYLREQLPYLWGKQQAQDKLIASLPAVFEEVRRKYDLAEGDFPNVEEFQRVLRRSDFSSFPHTNREVLLSLQAMLLEDIPRILDRVHGISASLLESGAIAEGDGEADGHGAKIRFMKIDETQRVSQQTLAVGLASIFTAVIVALFAVSAMEDHKTVLELFAQLMNFLDATLAIATAKSQ